jgi:hypothetical protein
MPVSTSTPEPNIAGSGVPIPSRGLESRAAPGNGNRRARSATGVAAQSRRACEASRKNRLNASAKFFGLSLADSAGPMRWAH